MISEIHKASYCHEPEHGFTQRRRASFTSMCVYQHKTHWILGILAVTTLTIAQNLLALGLPIYSMQVIGRVIPTGAMPTLTAVGLIMAVVAVTYAVTEATRASLVNRLTRRSAIAVRQALKTSSLQYREQSALINALTRLQALSSGGTVLAILDLPCSALFVLGMFALHSWLGYATLMAIAVTAMVGIGSYGLTHPTRQYSAARTFELFRTTEAIRTFEAASASPRAQSRLGLRMFSQVALASVAGGVATEAQAKVSAASNCVRLLTHVVMLSLTAVVICRREVPIGAILATTMLFTRAVAPFERTFADFGSIVEALKLVQEVRRGLAQSRPLQQLVSVPVTAGSLRLEAVTLTAAGRRLPILDDITLNVSPGELLVILGATGSGKSTLAAIIAGARLPSNGSVRLDGHALTDIDKVDLATHIGYLPDQAALSGGTIADVIADGVSASSQDVFDAAVLAGVHHVIQHLPQGYNTVLEEGQTVLSGGEKQRIALARAFLGRPSFVILDSPELHLDESGILDLVSAVQVLKDSGSAIVVMTGNTHFTQMQDRLVMLEKGRLACEFKRDAIRQFLASRVGAA